MAEGVCSRKRAKIVVVALVVVSVIAASIAVIVYFSVKNSKENEDSLESNGPQPIFRLPSSVKPLHYELQLTPDIYRSNPSDFTLSGKVVIRLFCQEVTSVIILHAVGLQISRDDMKVTSSVDDVPSPIIKSWEMDETRETLSLQLDTALRQNHNYSVHLNFQAPLTERFQAVYYSSYSEHNQTKYLAATIFVPTYARMAFPCFDEPALKAMFTLTLFRKADFIALSNMPLQTSESRQKDGEEWVADTFQVSPPMSTYLLTFTVCQFQSQQANTSRGYTFKAWSRPETVEETAYALEVGTRVMPFFDDYFGIKFPLPEQEMIALPEFQYGGMEHWGLVTYKERTLLYSDLLPSSADRQRIATIIAHELGHMWFGDLLTMVWWDDTWLNEGFASYVQYLGIDYAYPAWKMREQFLTLTFRVAMNIDAFEQSRPLYKPVTYPQDALAAYDRVIYYKGASVIKMVKFFLGEKTFKRGIQNYLDQFKYSSATHADLWNALNTEAEIAQIPVNVSDVMRGWTIQNNFPVVTVTRSRQGQMTVSQQRFLLKAGSSGEVYKWDIPFTFATRSTHQPDQELGPADVIWLSRHRTESDISHQSIPGPEDEDEWLLGNIGCYGYYRVNYEESNWRALIKQLNTDHQRIGTANRVQIIMDSWSLAKAGHLNYTLALETLGYLQRERQYVPWHAALSELGGLKHILSSNLTVYEQFATFMQRQTATIFESYDPNTALLEDLDRRTPLLVARAACTYDLPACVNIAVVRFSHWTTQPDNNTINVDLRLTVYCTALAYGNRSDWDFVFSRFMQESTANERSRLRLALACSRDPETLNTADFIFNHNSLINRTLDPSYIRGQDALETLEACASNVHGRSLVWRFVRDNFPVLYERFGGTAFMLKGLFSGITQSFHTQQQLQELEELAEQYPDAAAAMSDAMETTRANIEWVQSNMAAVDRWLREQNALSSTG